jgi:hypothetical protein
MVALEQQLAQLRWLSSDRARLYFERFSGHAAAGNPLDFRDAGALHAYALTHGAPYYWSPPLCDLLSTVAADLPEHWTLTSDLVPTEAWWFWFARPLPLPAYSGRPLPLVALTWATPWRYRADDPARLPADAVFFMSVTHDDVPGGPPGFPTQLIEWKFGAPMSEPLDVLRGAHIGYPERAQAKLRLAAAAFALVNQRILGVEQHRAHRGLRRRAAAVLATEATVRVIHLRRRAGASQEGRAAPGVPPEWSCQWIVRGHWRDQWYPSLGRHQPVWVLPYVKGPEDKPLRAPRGELFAVVR